MVRTPLSTDTSMSRSGSTPGSSALITRWSPSMNSSTLMSRKGHPIAPKGAKPAHRSVRSRGHRVREAEVLLSFDSLGSACSVIRTPSRCECFSPLARRLRGNWPYRPSFRLGLGLGWLGFLGAQPTLKVAGVARKVRLQHQGHIGLDLGP